MKPVNIIVRKIDTGEIEFIKRLSPYQRNEVSVPEITNVLVETYGDKDYSFEIGFRLT